MDIGGGSGGLVATLCAEHPELRGTLFDLLRICKIAAEILGECPGGDRVAIESGDILAAPPKDMHDAAVMKSVVQMFSPTDAARAIANAALQARAQSNPSLTFSEICRKTGRRNSCYSPI